MSEIGRAGEGGHNGDACERPRDEAETGWRTTARGRKTLEEERRPRDHDTQVSSDEDWGECQGERQGESEAAREG